MADGEDVTSPAAPPYGTHGGSPHLQPRPATSPLCSLELTPPFPIPLLVIWWDACSLFVLWSSFKDIVLSPMLCITTDIFLKGWFYWWTFWLSEQLKGSNWGALNLLLTFFQQMYAAVVVSIYGKRQTVCTFLASFESWITCVVLQSLMDGWRFLDENWSQNLFFFGTGTFGCLINVLTRVLTLICWLTKNFISLISPAGYQTFRTLWFSFSGSYVCGYWIMTWCCDVLKYEIITC